MDNLKDKGVQDRTRISLSEDWEVQYWTKELGVSKDELQKAINAVGNSTEAIKKYFKKS